MIDIEFLTGYGTLNLSSVIIKSTNGKLPKTDKEWKDFLEGRGYRGGLDYPPALFYR